MIHLIIGPVGAGKSTYATELAEKHRAVRFTLDEWMAVLFGDDPRPAEGRLDWYVERTERCIEQVWRLTQQLVAVGTTVVLEIGLIRREARQRFYGKLDAAALEHVVHVVDADRDVRRARVEHRNHERGATFSIEVPPDFFEFASDMWQPPDALERSDREHRDVAT